MSAAKSTLRILNGKTTISLRRATTTPKWLWDLAKFYVKHDGKATKLALLTNEEFTAYITRYYVTDRTAWHPRERLQALKDLAKVHILPELYIEVK